MINGVEIVEGTLINDLRGQTFKKSLEFSRREFTPNQFLISRNIVVGTFRGIHYQNHIAPEFKFITVIQGSIMDVLVDLRLDSSTYLEVQYVALESNGFSIFVPPGIGHGYITLEENTDVMYLIQGTHAPSAAVTINYQSPKLGIKLPVPVQAISPNDRNAKFL